MGKGGERSLQERRGKRGGDHERLDTEGGEKEKKKSWEIKKKKKTTQEHNNTVVGEVSVAIQEL